MKDIIVCINCKKKFRTTEEEKSNSKNNKDNLSKEPIKSKDNSNSSKEPNKSIDKSNSNNQNNKLENPESLKYINRKFKCPYCRTLNIIVEKYDTSIDKKATSDKKCTITPKVSVTLHETIGSGPTLDYLREYGMPDWIKDNM